MMDRFVPFIKETFDRYPNLSASVVYEMAKKRGYPGGPDNFRHRIRELSLRPRKTPEAFFALRTLSGEQAQVDWAHFGSRKVEGGVRKLYAFVMVLSYSRSVFFRFFYDMRMPSFLEGHVQAYAFFGGAAKINLYDNLKSAVIQRHGPAIVFHPKLLELADYYGFDPRPVAVRRGNEKGRVERAIRYLRTSFFPLRSDWDIDALNRDALIWCGELSMQRPWPQDKRRTVRQAYLEERPSLLPLKSEPFLCHELVPVSARKSLYVSFDSNRYSFPHQHVGRSLMISASVNQVRIFDKEILIAEHQRCFDKGKLVEDSGHIVSLRRAKSKARRQRERDVLIRAVPSAGELLVRLAKRQRLLQPATMSLLELLSEVGAKELGLSIDEALEGGSPSPESVRFILDRRRAKQGLAPPLALRLCADPRISELVVTPHSLGDYDPNDNHQDDNPEEDSDE